MILVVKNPPANAGDIRTWVGSLSQEDPLQPKMATHFSFKKHGRDEGKGIVQNKRLGKYAVAGGSLA